MSQMVSVPSAQVRTAAESSVDDTWTNVSGTGSELAWPAGLSLSTLFQSKDTGLYPLGKRESLETSISFSSYLYVNFVSSHLAKLTCDMFLIQAMTVFFLYFPILTCFLSFSHLIAWAKSH